MSLSLSSKNTKRTHMKIVYTKEEILEIVKKSTAALVGDDKKLTVEEHEYNGTVIVTLGEKNETE